MTALPSTRFMVDVVTMIGGAFLVVSSIVFAAPVLNWLAFGVSTGLAVILVAGRLRQQTCDPFAPSRPE